MDHSRRGFIETVAAFLLVPAPRAFAASGVDYPAFVFAGQARMGNPIRPVEAKSNSTGVLQIDLGQVNFFHTFGLTITDLPADQLRFRYKCAFLFKSKTDTSPSRENGEQCPSFLPDRVRAMSFWLEGTEKDNYVLRYGGRVQFKGTSNPPRPYQNLKPREWLGTELPSQGAADEWVASVEISLHRD